MSVNREAVYDNLVKMVMTLDDSEVITPSYIQERLVQCRNNSAKVDRHFCDIKRELTVRERMFRVDRLNISIRKRQTLINNESIKKLPTGKEREAAVDELLEDDYQRLLLVENEVAALRDLLDSVKTIQFDLKATNSDIKALIRLMENQIRLNIGSPEDTDVKELYEGLSEVSELEEEMTLDDVESSEESLESETPSESAPGTQETATPEADSESQTDEDIVASFLDDDDSITDIESPSEEDPVSTPTEEAVEVPPKEGIPDTPTVEEPTTAPASSDLDLDALGIDIDESVTSTETSTEEPTEKPTVTSEELLVSTEVSTEAEIPTESEPEKVQAEPPKETSTETTTDIDINDILTSLDDE